MIPTNNYVYDTNIIPPMQNGQLYNLPIPYEGNQQIIYPNVNYVYPIYFFPPIPSNKMSTPMYVPMPTLIYNGNIPEQNTFYYQKNNCYNGYANHFYNNQKEISKLKTNCTQFIPTKRSKTEGTNDSCENMENNEFIPHHQINNTSLTSFESSTASSIENNINLTPKKKKKLSHLFQGNNKYPNGKSPKRYTVSPKSPTTRSITSSNSENFITPQTNNNMKSNCFISVKIKITKDIYKEIKININDNLYEITKDFVESEKLDDSLIEPIYMKISAAVKLSKELNNYHLSPKVVNKIQQKKMKRRRRIHEEDDEKELSFDDVFEYDNILLGLSEPEFVDLNGSF